MAAFIINLFKFTCAFFPVTLLGMNCIGKVSNGAVKLPPGVHLPDGTAVELIFPESQKLEGVSELKPGWFYDEFKKFSGIIKNGPPDLAENHDHFAHGSPKRAKS